MQETPFKVGDRIGPDDLNSWQYAGLSGKPGRDRHALRRFTKGHWTLEVLAYRDRNRVTKVVSIRTREEDASHWQETRQRLMRHRTNTGKTTG